MTTTEAVKAFKEKSRLINSQLLQHANAATTLGLNNLANALYEIAEDIQESVNHIDAACKEDLANQFLRSRQASENVFHAVLTGIAISKGKQDAS